MIRHKAEVRASRCVKSNVLVPYEEYDRVRTEYYRIHKECENQLDIVRKFLKPITNAYPEDEYLINRLLNKVFEGKFKTKIYLWDSNVDPLAQRKFGWTIDFDERDFF